MKNLTNKANLKEDVEKVFKNLDEIIEKMEHQIENYPNDILKMLSTMQNEYFQEFDKLTANMNAYIVLKTTEEVAPRFNLFKFSTWKRQKKGKKL